MDYTDPVESQALADILARVRACTGLDFSRYREATMRRRVRNRMIALGLRSLAQYRDALQAGTGEARLLVERLTIKVSRFYRNARVFDLLREDLLPRLARERAGRALRFWSAGCGRGEEAYTLAMLLEEGGIEGRILATDVDPGALELASAGVYREDALAELPGALRERFLAPAAGGWRVADALRARVEFCRHDLLGPLQPRGGSFDLVACRNVVIYLQDDMHDRAMGNLRAALADGAVLVLGEAEWPSSRFQPSLAAVAPRLRVFRAVAPEAIAA